MENEEVKISNKLIDIETIIKVANYLEQQTNEYNKLFIEEKEKNKDIPYNEKRYEYDGENPKVEYTIDFVDGRSVTEKDYDWFVNNLYNNKTIKHIHIKQVIYFNSNYDDINNIVSKHLFSYIDFYEDRVSISIDGKELKKEVQDNYNNIRNIIEDNKARYDKTIKNRKIRIQSFCLSIGFLIGYIALIVLFINYSKIPETYIKYVSNKYLIALAYWAISIVVGNTIGLGIMNSFYTQIIPERKFLKFNNQSGKSIYIDDVDDYINKNEVQIGKFYNSILKRNKIEKIFNITKIIVLIQIVITIIILVLVK